MMTGKKIQIRKNAKIYLVLYFLKSSAFFKLQLRDLRLRFSKHFLKGFGFLKLIFL